MIMSIAENVGTAYSSYCKRELLEGAGRHTHSPVAEARLLIIDGVHDNVHIRVGIGAEETDARDLECGDLSPLFVRSNSPVRTKSGDKSPHSKYGSISGRPLVRALPTGGGRILRRKFGREVIAYHAKRYDRREAILGRAIGHCEAGLVNRLQ